MGKTVTRDEIQAMVRDVPDFPKPGILFKDITPILKDPEVFRGTVAALAEAVRGERINFIVGIESRGFIFGAGLAQTLGAGFVPVRKPGKLPYRTVRETYQLEYGEDALEIHEDAVGRGDRVVIIDDLLATGGTAEAAVRLVRRLGAEVTAVAVVIELAFLQGRARLQGIPVYSLVTYGAE